MSHQKLTLSDLAAMPQFAPETIQIDPDILNMVLIPLDPAVIEAAELKAIHRDEIKAKVDDAKNLLKVRKERVAVLNALCDELDTLEEIRNVVKEDMGIVFNQVKTTLANDPAVLANKQKVVQYFPSLLSKWKENFDTAVVKQTQKLAADNIAAMKELNASFDILDKKIDAMNKEVDDYKALASRLFAEADVLKVEYGFA
jgi:paraquat-inducible protein B